MICSSAYSKGDYDWLYANYLAGRDRLSEAFSHLRQDVPPRLAVDLCCGTGYMTRQLADLGAKRIICVDSSQAMLTSLWTGLTPLQKASSDIKVLRGDFNASDTYRTLRRALEPGRADVIVCRQGVGYLDPVVLMQVPMLLRPGGSFLFNAFAKPRPFRLRRSGEILEAGVYGFGRVLHLQARWPRFDVTAFRWHDIPHHFGPAWLDLGFLVTVNRLGRSIITEVTAP